MCETDASKAEFIRKKRCYFLLFVLDDISSSVPVLLLREFVSVFAIVTDLSAVSEAKIITANEV